MNQLRHTYAARGFSRRTIELPCEVITRAVDAPLFHWGTNLSESGMFIETPAPLVAGDELVGCFRPAAGWRMPELTLFAQVARAAAGRRKGDAGSGVGLRFLDLQSGERRALSRWLQPRPRVPSSPRALNLATPAYLPPFGEHPFASRVS